MRNLSTRRWFSRWLLAMVALAELAVASSASATQRQKQVLVLYSTRRDAQIVVVGDRELPRILQNGLSEAVDYYSEFIDQARFPDPQYQVAFHDFLRLKYGEQRFDVVIAMDDLALEFVGMNRNQLFDDAPVIFFASSPDTQRITNSTGVITHINFRDTLALATELQPDTRHAFFVNGAGENEYERAARTQFRSFEPRITVTYLTGLPTKELEKRLAALPDHSIIYYAVVNRDGAGENFHPLEYLDRIAAIANAPIYSWVDSALDHGIVGGSLKSQKNEAEAVGKLALRVLNGERADAIPAVSTDLNVRQVDWRQLRRWDISEARIPAGVSVLFRQPTVFEQYEDYVIGTIVLLVLQTTLIGGLVIQRRHRRRAEELLRESEQHFRTMADTAPVMVWRSGPDMLRDFFNLPWLAFRGRTLEEEIGNGWTAGVHAEDRDYCTRAYAEAFERRESFRMEYRLRRVDGEYRWVLDTGVPRQLPDGPFSGYIGSCIDITERKNAEEALRTSEAKLRASNAQIQDLANRLITAQEAERARIARELHDDISQQVTLLTMDLALLRRAEQEEAERLAGEALNRAQDVARTVYDLSHRLHPAKLRLLGLVAALDALIHELSQGEIAITFAHDNVPSTLPADLTLCLFRIVQEGLQNALKYSKAHRVSVHLSGGPGGLALSIVDDGVGFEVDAAWGKGLGLISMVERLEAIGGSLEIRSKPGAGTHLKVTVTLEAVQSTQAAAV